MTQRITESKAGGSIAADEIARFAGVADQWWDPQGAFSALHRLNPVRLNFIRRRLAGHFGRDTLPVQAFSGLSLLDIGCGGGLIAEPMARMGFTVTGIDATEEGIAVAGQHAEAAGLAIRYRAVPAETLVGEAAAFDVVLALELIEHVAEPQRFLDDLAQLVKPGGAVILSTLNRTPKAWALGVVAAEYILGWVPRGTHDWKKFQRPAEIAAGLRRNGLVLREVTGLRYDPLDQSWGESADLGLNYMMLAVRPG